MDDYEKRAVRLDFADLIRDEKDPVTMLIDTGTLPMSEMRSFVIRKRFYQELRKGSRTVNDIECDLAAQYGCTVRWVRAIIRKELKG